MKSDVWLQKRPSKRGHVWHLRWVDPTTRAMRKAQTGKRGMWKGME